MRNQNTRIRNVESSTRKLDNRRSFGGLTQRTTRGVFRRPKQSLFNQSTGTGEARWA